MSPVCVRPETRRVGAGSPGAGGGGVLPLRDLALTHACAGAGRRGRWSTRSRGCDGGQKDRTNLKTYCWASYTGEEPVDDPSDDTVLVAPDAVGLGGRGGPVNCWLWALARATAAVSRRAASSCSSARGRPLPPAPEAYPALVVVKDNTLATRDHLFLASVFVDIPSSAAVGDPPAKEPSPPKALAKESNPISRPGCGKLSSCRMIMNFLPGVGSDGAVDGASLFLASASYLR